MSLIDSILRSDVGKETLRAAPAGAGAAYSWLTLNTGVAILTGAYVILQIAYLARKWWREEKDWRGRKRR